MDDHALYKILHEIECRFVGLDRRIDHLERVIRAQNQVLGRILGVLKMQERELEELERARHPKLYPATTGISVRNK